MTAATGDRVRDLRIRAGLSQLDLAQRAGLSDGFMSLLESGKRSASPAKLQAIAAVLGTSPEYLADGDDSPVETAVRDTIARGRAELEAGRSAAARDILRDVDPADVSHANRLDFMRLWGRILDYLGDVDGAIDWLEKALTEARAHADLRDVAEIGMWLIGAYKDAGSLNHAVSLGEQILAEVEADDSVTGTDQHLRLASTLLWILVERGDYMHSRTRAQHYLKIADELGTPRGRGSIYWNVALILQDTGRDDDSAIALAREALDLMLTAGSAHDIPRLRYDYATILLKAANPQPREALEQLQIALAEFERIGAIAEVGRCHQEIGRAHILLAAPDIAEDHITRGLQILTSAGSAPMDLCWGYQYLGDVAVLRQDAELAHRRYGWATERLALMAASRRAGEMWAGLARRLLAAGDADRAAQAFRRACDELAIISLQPQAVVMATAVTDPTAAPAVAAA